MTDYQRQKIVFMIKDGQPHVNLSLLDSNLLCCLSYLQGIKNSEVELISTSLGSNGVYLKTNEKINLNLDKFDYVQINDKKIKNHALLECYANTLFHRSFKSFFQTSYEVANLVHEIVVEHNREASKLIIIGGEMYVYAKLLGKNTNYLFSDFEGIVNDCIYNLYDHDKYQVNLIDYKTASLNVKDKDLHCIVNNGVSGLNHNLCHQLLNLDLLKITIVSCNSSSFERDYLLLRKRYLSVSKHHILKFPNSNKELNIYILKPI